MNYPWAALGFAALITCVLGIVATVVSGPVAPLPLFALILGVHTMLPISWPVSVILAVVLAFIHLGYRLGTNNLDFSSTFFQQVSYIRRTIPLQHFKFILNSISSFLYMYRLEGNVEKNKVDT